MLVILCEQFHFVNAPTCQLYNKTHKRCVSIIMKILVFLFFTVLFWRFLYSTGAVGSVVKMFCKIIHFYGYFFNIVKGFFCASWTNIPDPMWGVLEHCIIHYQKTSKNFQILFSYHSRNYCYHSHSNSWQPSHKLVWCKEISQKLHCRDCKFCECRMFMI